MMNDHKTNPRNASSASSSAAATSLFHSQLQSSRADTSQHPSRTNPLLFPPFLPSSMNGDRLPSTQAHGPLHQQFMANCAFSPLAFQTRQEQMESSRVDLMETIDNVLDILRDDLGDDNVDDDETVLSNDSDTNGHFEPC